jgi:HD-like signal output (HDOD) protein
MLAEAVPREYEPVIRWHLTNGGPIHATEASQLDYDHAGFGQQIFSHWGLPQVICEAIGGHHDPSRIDTHGELPRGAGSLCVPR